MTRRRRARAARLVVADDHDVARLGLVAILNSIPGVTVVGEAHDVPSAVAAVLEHEPDLILLDVRMPPTNGFDGARQIGRKRPATRVIIVSTWDYPEYEREAAEAGALGFLSKGAPREIIAAAVQRALQGERLGAAPAPSAPDGGERTSATVALNAIEALTPRQCEILELIAVGLTNKAIAAELNLKEATVKTMAERIYRRLGVPNRTQASLLWMLAGRGRQ